MSAFKFYVDADGNYLGATDSLEPLEGGIEVPYPPSHCKQKWAGDGYTEYISVEQKQKLIMDKALEILQPAQRAKLAVALAGGQLLMNAGDTAGLKELLVQTVGDMSDAEIPFLQYVSGVLSR